MSTYRRRKVASIGKTNKQMREGAEFRYPLNEHLFLFQTKNLTSVTNNVVYS